MLSFYFILGKHVYDSVFVQPDLFFLLRSDCRLGSALVEEFTDMGCDIVTIHGLGGQEFCALDAPAALFCSAPAGEGLIHLPFA